jgi:hypothetical protein
MRGEDTREASFERKKDGWIEREKARKKEIIV